VLSCDSDYVIRLCNDNPYFILPVRRKYCDMCIYLPLGPMIDSIFPQCVEIVKPFVQESVDNDFDVSSATANRMSLFYAHATPMLKVLSDTTSRFVSEVSVYIKYCNCAEII
jgi:CYRIA/CYRIB Rac1 binding domain